mmetsp:Transcript_55478/g.142862  ORF Transcript_55478/g.142862 Transcript_55478/m.142862 type:complete len:370 (+) Transcript_55478:469-1578(+)
MCASCRDLFLRHFWSLSFCSMLASTCERSSEIFCSAIDICRAVVEKSAVAERSRLDAWANCSDSSLLDSSVMRNAFICSSDFWRIAWSLKWWNMRAQICRFCRSSICTFRIRTSSRRATSRHLRCIVSLTTSFSGCASSSDFRLDGGGCSSASSPGSSAASPFEALLRRCCAARSCAAWFFAASFANSPAVCSRISRICCAMLCARTAWSLWNFPVSLVSMPVSSVIEPRTFSQTSPLRRYSSSRETTWRSRMTRRRRSTANVNWQLRSATLLPTRLATSSSCIAALCLRSALPDVGLPAASSMEARRRSVGGTRLVARTCCHTSWRERRQARCCCADVCRPLITLLAYHPRLSMSSSMHVFRSDSRKT